MMDEYTETVFSVNDHYTVLDIPSILAIGEYAMMEFGSNLKRYRKAKDWNQATLGEQMDVAQATIQRWEAGTREPTHADLERLASVLEVSVADLFRVGGDDPLPNAEELARMIERAMEELPVGVSYADYPRAVSTSLHGQLTLWRAAGGYQGSEGATTSPGKVARSRRPTKPTAGGAPRNP